MRKRTTLGLILLFVLYIGLGTVAFRYLEEPNEIESRARSYNQVTQWYTHNSSSSITNDTLSVLIMLQEAHNTGALTLLIRNQTLEDAINLWNIQNSMFFVLTVVTTIGYGNQAPATEFGRVFCIAYAIAGIPLCLVLIAALGKHLYEMNSWLSNKITKGRSQRVKSMVSTTLLVVVGLVSLVLTPCTLIVWKCRWTFWQALYYVVITLTTIGFGDLVIIGSSIFQRFMLGMWIILGLTWFSGILSDIQDRYSSVATKADKRDDRSAIDKDSTAVPAHKVTPVDEPDTKSETQLTTQTQYGIQTVKPSAPPQTSLTTVIS